MSTAKVSQETFFVRPPPGWPAVSIAESNRILTAEGSPFEVETKVIKNRKLRVYKHQAHSAREFYLQYAAKYAAREALVYQDERYTYAQQHAAVLQYAHFLSTDLGLVKGDNVAIISRNLPEYIFIFWATQLLGLVAVNVNAWNPTEGLVHCIDLCECKAVFLDEERARALEGQQTTCSRFFLLRGTNPTFPTLSVASAAHRGRTDIPAVTVVDEDPAIIFFTSGTTGFPKAVLSTQRQYLTNRLNTLQAMARANLRAGLAPAPVDPPLSAPQRAVLMGVPLFHVTGNQSFLLSMTGQGGKIVMMHRWNVEEAIRLILAEGVNQAGGVPIMTQELLFSRLAAMPPGSHKLDVLVIGGGPPSINMPLWASERLPQVKLNQSWGLTENNAVATNHCWHDYYIRPRSCGLPTVCTDIKVIDESGRSLGPMQEGEICIHGPQVSEGYVKNPEATAENFSPDGWFRSGDVGYIDLQGFVYITDRAKDIIIRGGENISSLAVENAILASAKIKEAAAIGVKDEKMGELVSAIVVTYPEYDNTLTESDIQGLVAARLPKHCVPVLVSVRPSSQPLERSVTAKVLKKELKKPMNDLWIERNKSKAKL